MKNFSFTVKDIKRPKEDHKAVSVVHSAIVLLCYTRTLQALGYVLTANSWYIVILQ